MSCNARWQSTIASIFAAISLSFASQAMAAPPVPLLEKGGAGVDWWFVFKFNAKPPFLSCANNAQRKCIFGGKKQNYPTFSQQFLFASNDDPKLKEGVGCLGDNVTDPV